MKIKILCLFSLILPTIILANNELSSFPTDELYYTIQIKSFAWQERDKAVELYEMLKKKNYLVYHKHKSVNGNSYSRVRVEIFKKLSDAKLFAKKFKEKEGFDYFIDVADVLVEEYKDQFSIITTQQAIIYRDKEKFYELCKGGQTRISPDGKQIVFLARPGICILDIKTKATKVLKEFDGESDEARSLEPKWSPDGKYIAYLVKNNWELHTELWAVKSDGTGDKCLIPYNREKQCKVKYHIWHPRENKIFYVFGQTFGTITVGGNLYLTDIQGNSKILLKAGKGEEIYEEFRIFKNVLYYKLCIFGEQALTREFTLHNLDINSIQ